MIQRELHTERLHLVPLSQAHLKHQIELDSNPEVMHFLHGTRDADASQKDLTHFIETAERGLGFWAGFVNGEFAGYWILCITELTVEEGFYTTAELGYRLLPRFWRQGLAREGALELIRYGFEEIEGLQEIVAYAEVDNVGSRATMLSVGLKFIQEFEVDLEDWPEHASRQSVEYSLSSKEWFEQKNKT